MDALTVANRLVQFEESDEEKLLVLKNPEEETDVPIELAGDGDPPELIRDEVRAWLARILEAERSGLFREDGL